MPPKQRQGCLAKQCEECGGSNPVACKVCKSVTLYFTQRNIDKKNLVIFSGTACGADFYGPAREKPSSPDDSNYADSTGKLSSNSFLDIFFDELTN